RQDTAKEGIRKLRNVAEHTIVLENDRLLQLAGDVSITESFAIMERSINGLIDSMTHQISEDVVAPIREEVDAYMRERASVEIVNHANTLPVTQMISTLDAHKTVEISFISSADPQLLSR